MFCKECGKMIKNGEAFCPNCGKKTLFADKDNFGSITVIRKSKVMGFAIPFNVSIDGDEIGSLSNGASITHKVPLGKHDVAITFAASHNSREVELKSDKKNVTITFVAAMGMITAKPRIVSVTYD